MMTRGTDRGQRRQGDVTENGRKATEATLLKERSDLEIETWMLYKQYLLRLL